MFATSGYFKGVDCPYYKSDLCERAYCHFRHVKKEKNKDAASSYSQSTSHVGNQRPSSPLDKSLLQGSGPCIGPTGSKSQVDSLSKKGLEGSISNPAPASKYGVEDEEYSVDHPDSEGLYEPTPKYDITGGKKKKKRQDSTDCIYQPGGPAVEVPEYEPNHIPGSKPAAEVEYKPGSVKKPPEKPSYIPGSLKTAVKHLAKKRRANPVPDVIPEYVPSTIAKYNPTPITQLKKMKKPPEEDVEYDPVNNYVCSSNSPEENVGEVVYVPTKRKKVDVPPDGGMCMDLDLNLEEFGDSDDAKFSDIDEGSDNSELIMDSGRYESPLDEDTDDEVSEIFSVKPFFKDHQNMSCKEEKAKMEIEENELKHPVRKPLICDKVPSDSSVNKKEQGEKTKSADSSKPKCELSNNSSSRQSHHSAKSSSKESLSKTSDHSKKDKTSSSSKSKVLGSSKDIKTSSSGTGHSASVKTSENSSKTILSRICSSISKGSSSTSKSSSSSKSNLNSTKDSSSESKKTSSDKNSSDSKSQVKTSKHSSSERSKKHDRERTSSGSERKTDSQKSHATENKHRSSSKESSHRKEHHKDSRNHETSSSKIKGHTSSSSSKSKDHKSSGKSSHSEHQRKGSASKSEKENKSKHESKGSKNHGSRRDKEQDLTSINADLFGSDSEDEMVTKQTKDPNEMTDAEIAMFLEDSDFECETDPFEECLKIFQESGAAVPRVRSEKKPNQVVNSGDAPVPGKKRVAHAGETRAVKSVSSRGPVKMSPAQVMHNRLVEMQRRALEAAEARKVVEESHASSSSSSSSLNTSNNKRVAHAGKSKSDKGRTLDDRDETKRTLAITAAKGKKRTAHPPTISNIKRPTIPAEFGSKVPSNIRQRYLNLIIDECLKICKTEEGAYKKGQEEETAVYNRATNKNIYLRVAVNAIKRLRVEVEQKSPSSSKTSPHKIVKQSHEAMLGGKNATKTTYTIHRSGTKSQTDNFKGAELYKRLSPYIMTEQQLKDNGYPRSPYGGGSTAVFYSDRNEKDVILKAHEKNCVRCGKRFIVFPNGNYNREEECVYHWGKAWKKRVDRALISTYNCCGGDLGSEGCQVCKCHVYESNKADNVTGYMKSIPTSPPIDGDYGVYAMDCEMVYTKGGMELARVTVIDPDSKPVYETVVKPEFPVVDYNTRFSGLSEEDLQGVKTTLRDVQAVLLSLFTDKTILIGHSLESDLISVKLIHSTVVDTSVVFPHRLGPPYKRALRNLMVDFLKKIIQDDVGGHDSQEDAVACMLLMHWKLKEDAKKEIRHS